MTPGETNVATKDTLPEKGQSSDGKDGSTSKTPETYTKEQTQKLVSDALAEQGRKHKAELTPIVTERDTLKTQLEANTADLESNKTEMEELQAKIDDMASGDPTRYDAVKELKAAKEERKHLQVKERALEAEKRTHGERIKKAEDLEKEVLVLEIVEGYKDADAEKLTNAIVGFETTFGIKVTSDEQIRKVADTLWTKKETETPKGFSGVTEGGGTLTEQDKLNRRYPTMK